MYPTLSITIKKLLPDSRGEETPNGDSTVDNELIQEWTNQVIELDTWEDLKMEDEENSPDVDLSDISQYFFDKWTGQTGWLFHELVIELPFYLKGLLSEIKEENQFKEEWFLPGIMFCPRKQVIEFV